MMMGQESSQVAQKDIFGKIPSISSINESISNAGNKANEAVKNAPLPEPVKKVVNAGAEKVVDTVQGKVAEVVKVADAVVNNPLTNAAANKAGPKTKDNVEKVQRVVNEIKQNDKIVGKNKFWQMPTQPIQ